MKQIGFKNFRRFENLEPLDLNPVTVFVGENNAGKSTVVKAILAVLDFVKTRVSSLEDDSWMNINFFFNKSYYTHLGTFDRARYNRASEDDPIIFILTLGDRRYEITVEKPELDDAVYGRVSRIKVTMLPYNVDITFSLRSDRSIHVAFHGHPNPDYDIYRCPAPNSVKSPINYFSRMRGDIEFDTTLVDGIRFSSEYIIDALMKSFEARLDATLKSLNSNALIENDMAIYGLSDETKRFLIENGSTLRSKRFMAMKQKEIDVEYIYAHAVTQTILFSAKDTNDYHVKTVHEFANLQVSPNSPANDFIIEWMEKFKVGQDYRIDSVGGEAHIVKIQNFDGEWVNLADKGMGSIQLMILLYRIATKMAEAGIGYGKKKVNSLLIVEEPEQNLHPMLQSVLADLFYSLSKKYGFRFIIETHSEYLIRKSQVLVAGESQQMQLDLPDQTTYKVIYFPSDDTPPYDMIYRPDGKFSNEFGPGFFDEAANLAFKLF